MVSLLFSFYTANFASYSKTYGTLASIVVVLLWLFLSALAVLLGAEVDAIRRSTRRGRKREIKSPAHRSLGAGRYPGEHRAGVAQW